VLAGLLEPGQDERVAFLLEHLGFKLWHAALEQTTEDGQLEVLKGLQDFQEHLGGELTITLLEALGKGAEVHSMDPRKVIDASAWLKQRYQG
jgi:3-dehydroquinate synthase